MQPAPRPRYCRPTPRRTCALPRSGSPSGSSCGRSWWHSARRPSMPAPQLIRFRHHQPHIKNYGANASATFPFGCPSPCHPRVAPGPSLRSAFAKLEDQHRAGLWNRCCGASNLVDAVLNALRIKSPTSRDGDVLLAIDFKGRWNTNHARGSREAPELIPRARVERPELPVGRSTREEQVPSRHQKRRPEDGLEVVLPDALAGIQIPGLKLAEMIGGTRGGANGPEDALHFVSNIEPVDAVLRHITLRQKGADVVVRRDVQELRLRTPRLRRPVLSTSDARAELGALRDARTLRFIEDRSSRLRVNRRENVVVGEPEGVEKLQLSLIAIQNPEVSIAAGMCSRLDRLSVDLGVDQQGCRHFVPVKRIVRRVLVIALQLAGLDVDRQRRVRVQVVVGTIVSNPRRRISGAPVGDDQCGIEDAGDPDGATSALVRIALPGVSA